MYTVNRTHSCHCQRCAEQGAAQARHESTAHGTPSGASARGEARRLSFSVRPRACSLFASALGAATVLEDDLAAALAHMARRRGGNLASGSAEGRKKGPLAHQPQSTLGTLTRCPRARGGQPPPRDADACGLKTPLYN